MTKKSLILKQIKTLNEFRMIEKQQNSMFDQSYLDKQKPNLNTTNWNQAKNILSLIVDEDFNLYSKKMSKPRGTEGSGWTDAGFVPDELMQELLYPSGGPSQVYKNLIKIIETLKKNIFSPSLM